VRREWFELDGPLRQRVQELLQAPPAASATMDLATLDRDLGKALGEAGKAAIAHARLSRQKLAGAGLWGLAIGPAAPLGAAGRAAEIRLGSPAEVAAAVGLPIVSGFAQSDQAAGGAGGPLSPWVDYHLLHDVHKARVVLDLGKVATLTFLPAAGQLADTLAFDTGPGTAVLDELARRHHGQPYDRDGAIAGSGRPAAQVVADLISTPYFSQPPPATTKRSFRTDWQGRYVDRVEAAGSRAGIAGADLLATAVELTIETIVRAAAQLTQRPHEVILCGGGARNITLGIRLRDRLSPASTVAMERFDVDAASKDAFNAAALTAARLLNLPANIPQVTGARQAVRLGSITEP
jgi:anhydro-N-acetylmuramic acid kinase